MKILIRGGALASGRGVSRSYADILREIFPEHEIINVSAAGDNSFDAVRSFDNDIRPRMPDLVIINFGIEDAWAPVYRSEFKENLVQFVRLCRALCGPQIMLITSQPFQNLYDMQTVNIYYRTIREVALDLDCRHVPVHTYWAGIMYEKIFSTADFVQGDDRLPNERGHEIFAEVLKTHIEAVIESGY